MRSTFLLAALVVALGAAPSVAAALGPPFFLDTIDSGSACDALLAQNATNLQRGITFSCRTDCGSADAAPMVCSTQAALGRELFPRAVAIAQPSGPFGFPLWVSADARGSQFDAPPFTMGGPFAPFLI